MIYLYLVMSVSFFIISFLVAVWQDCLAFDYRKFCPEFFIDNQDYFYIFIIFLFFTSLFIVFFSKEIGKCFILVNILEYFLKKCLSRAYSVNMIVKEIVRNNYKISGKTFNTSSIKSIKKYLREERKNLL